MSSIAQLAGKPVSFGPEGGPGEIVGRRIFAKLRIQVAETPLDLDNALDGLATGDLAAVLILRDRDADKLKSIVLAGAGSPHLLPIPADTAPPRGLTAALIPLGTPGAPRRSHAIRAYAVAETLIAHLAREMASAH